MKTIWKYNLPAVWKANFEEGSGTTHVTIALPRGAELLDVQLQSRIELTPNPSTLRHAEKLIENPVLWAIVQTDQPLEDREFLIAMTGADLTGKDWNGSHAHIGTFQLRSLVFHVFVKI